MSENDSTTIRKNFLSFHTVFILNENIKWLEEFIIYYRNIGFDHFYLYDNEDSNGEYRDGIQFSTKHMNKYGFSINTSSSQDNKLILDNILNKYKDYITYIKWQPKENGVVIYGQRESVYDCILKYGKDNEWLAFFDLDEFIYSLTEIHLPSYLKSLDRSVSCVKLIQKKFLDRFLSSSSLITQEVSCINDLEISTNWGPKNIVRVEDFTACHSIHNMGVKFNTIVPKVDVLRFNHYNINDKQLKWMKEFYKSTSEFKINGKDHGMIRYKDIFNRDTV